MSPRLESYERVPSRLAEHVGIALWISFLSACVATLLFFACFDPATLAIDSELPRWLADRRSGYAIGFFFFWWLAATASLFTVYMIDSRRGTSVQ